jgi:hypothetical protein
MLKVKIISKNYKNSLLNKKKEFLTNRNRLLDIVKQKLNKINNKKMIKQSK